MKRPSLFKGFTFWKLMVFIGQQSCSWQLVVSSRSPCLTCVSVIALGNSGPLFCKVCMCVCLLCLIKCMCIFLYILLLVCACTHVCVSVYLCMWTSWKVWWAAVCLSCHRAQHSGQCQAPCSHSSPSLTATACGSHSTEGWHPEPWEGGQTKREGGRVKYIVLDWYKKSALYPQSCLQRKNKGNLSLPKDLQT